MELKHRELLKTESLRVLFISRKVSKCLLFSQMSKSSHKRNITLRSLFFKIMYHIPHFNFQQFS